MKECQINRFEEIQYENVQGHFLFKRNTNNGWVSSNTFIHFNGHHPDFSVGRQVVSKIVNKGRNFCDFAILKWIILIQTSKSDTVTIGVKRLFQVLFQVLSTQSPRVC